MTTPVGALTFAEIAARVKRSFGDEVGAQITDMDIARWFDDAQREIAQANNLLQAKATTPIIAADNGYALPDDLLTLHSVKYKGINLTSSTLEQVDNLSLNSTASGEPQLYYIWDKTINIYPIPPTAGENLAIYYTRQPAIIPKPANVPQTTFVSELPTQYHSRIVDYCLAQARELDDDDQGHQLKMSQFNTGLALLKENSEQRPTEAYPSLTYIED